LRVTKVFWALDAKLAQRRHFPSINWLQSYSLYLKTLEGWFTENAGADWLDLVSRFMTILQEEEKLMEIVQLVGSDALPDKEQVTLEVARVIREGFLQQNAFHEVDTFCEHRKTYAMMKLILHYADLAYAALEEGARVQEIVVMKSKDKVAEVKFAKDYDKLVAQIKKDMEDPKTLEIIEQDRKDGEALGLRGTPTFFVNGKPLEEFGYRPLRDMVAKELSE